MLPSDYAGPPASAVSGNVAATAGTSKDARRPRLSLEWLAGFDGTVGSSLVSQPLAFQRSAKLQNDWEIGVQFPVEAVRLRPPQASGSRARFGVGKIVYNDDRLADGRLDWSCRRSICDLVKSVSAEFVVFVETPTCQARGDDQLRQRLTAGLHYFHFEGGVITELASGEAMSFIVTDQPPLASDPTGELRAFATALFGSWRRPGALDGC
jgi:hypothetical protein